MCTIDVVGLYPNIPCEYVLDALRNSLDLRDDQTVSTDFLIELAELVLKKTVFSKTKIFLNNDKVQR